MLKDVSSLDRMKTPTPESPAPAPGLDRDRVWRAARTLTGPWDIGELRMISGQYDHPDALAEYVTWLVVTGLARHAGICAGRVLYRLTRTGRETLATPRPTPAVEPVVTVKSAPGAATEAPHAA